MSRDPVLDARRIMRPQITCAGHVELRTVKARTPSRMPALREVTQIWLREIMFTTSVHAEAHLPSKTRSLLFRSTLYLVR
jgi:hypothetical protein